MNQTWTATERHHEAREYAAPRDMALSIQSIQQRATVAESLVRDHIDYEVDWDAQTVILSAFLGYDLTMIFQDARNINHITGMKVVFDFNAIRVTVERKPTE